jgi:hypothetical protein
MVKATETDRDEDQDQNKLSDSDGTFKHGAVADDMDEFSCLLAKVSTDVLWNVLMTQQQRILATALWQACNYGGRPKPQDLVHMEKKRVYAEWVLRIDHQQQWEKAQKRCRLVESKNSSDGTR